MQLATDFDPWIRFEAERENTGTFISVYLQRESLCLEFCKRLQQQKISLPERLGEC